MKAAIALALLMAVACAGCANVRPDGDAIVIAVANSPVNLDPRVGTDEVSQKAHQLLYNTLVKLDTDLTLVPELAESLEQPDPVTYVATLRKGVLFHNGREPPRTSSTRSEVFWIQRSVDARERTGSSRRWMRSIATRCSSSSKNRSRRFA